MEMNIFQVQMSDSRLFLILDSPPIMEYVVVDDGSIRGKTVMMVSTILNEHVDSSNS